MTDVGRDERILEMLRHRPFASVHDLVENLSVSPATARRDIDKLDEMGLARKVHGGVSALAGTSAHSVFARSYSESSDVAVAAKRAIAVYAAGMVQNGDAVVIHGGSTCFQLGTQLADRNIRLCTNSMPLAAVLGERGSCALTIVGGELHREPRIMHGAAPPFYASKFFLSAQGASDKGLLESHPLLIEAAARFAANADRIIALVDSSKFAAGARSLSMPWSRIDTLVTDDGISDADRTMLEERGVDLRITAVTAPAP